MKRWNAVRQLLARSNIQRSYLVVGLGNPGTEYHLTRHNVGFRVCDELARTGSGNWMKTKYRANVWLGNIEEQPVALLKPRTFVNKSGHSVLAASQELSIEPAGIIVVHDDMDLGFGRLRLRSDGGAGGHNGVKSIIQALNTDKFQRVKIGLGRPPDNIDPATYVLGEFSSNEQPIVQTSIHEAAAAVRTILAKGMHTAMGAFNVIDVADRSS